MYIGAGTMYGALVWRTMRRRGAVRSGDGVAQGEGDGEGKMLRTVVEVSVLEE
jgi:hypothetical protein